jgi:hypothetical protein
VPEGLRPLDEEIKLHDLRGSEVNRVSALVANVVISAFLPPQSLIFASPMTGFMSVSACLTRRI